MNTYTPSDPSHPLQYRANNVSETDTRSEGTLEREAGMMYSEGYIQ